MTWLENIGSYLQTQSVGTLGTNIFYQDFDSITSNCICLISQAGQNSKTTLRNTMELVRHELGVRVRNTNDTTADSKALTIYNLLNHTYNTTIGSTRFKSIKAVSPPFFVGQDKNNNYIYSINFSLEISE